MICYQLFLAHYTSYVEFAKRHGGKVAVAEYGFDGSRLRSRRKCWKKSTIKSAGNDAYTVSPLGSKRWYSVSVHNRERSCMCSWPRHASSLQAKAVVNVCMLPEPEKVDSLVLDPVPENKHPRCNAGDAAKAGVRKNENFNNQIHKCRSCKRRLSANLGFEKPRCIQK